MIIAFWTIAGLAAAVLFAAGTVKLVRPIPALKEAGMGWVDDYPSGVIRLIALAEVVGAVGLLLPMATGIAPVLSPIAGVALAVLMIGAIVILVRRKESPIAAIAAMVLALVAAVLGIVLITS